MKHHIKILLKNIKNKEGGELDNVRLVAVESDLEAVMTNEVLYLLHALGRKDNRLAPPSNNRFIYMFPFKLS